jgi:hypothetical protein
MHVEWKGNNSARERYENACGMERKQFSEGKVLKYMWNGKDTNQRGKGKKMHVK